MATEQHSEDRRSKPTFDPDSQHHGDKQSLLVHMLILQVKLIADGLRDAVLIPVSLVAALAGLLMRTQDPWLWYREVLLWGRASDHWIDLFDSYRHQADPDFDDLMQATRTRLQQDQDNTVKNSKAGAQGQDESSAAD